MTDRRRRDRSGASGEHRTPAGTRGRIADEALVARIRRGDASAFDTLVRRYLRPAMAIAWELAGSREDAEDVVQDAFLRALRGLEGFDERREFRPWLYAIVRNAGRDAARRRTRWRPEPLADSHAASQPGLSAIERREVRDRIGDGLERLSEQQRACFRLCDCEGFATAEAAEMLDIEEATVRVHLHRARRRLREVLEPLRGETGSDG